ncbi:MAG: hypothetical protein EB015_13230, partial [Methylocystaceae bacterium]|nr:hypothetical protein [Methylocystaceae bacterium]
MGGKTGTATSQVTIPPEIMARYNAVNARAEEAAGKPFQEYGGQFVAPLTSTQQGAVSGVNAAQGMYQPYGTEAYQRTQEAMGGADPLNQAASGQYNAAYGQGQNYLGASNRQAELAYDQGQNYLGAGTTAAYQASNAGQNALNEATVGTRGSLGAAQAALAAGQPYQQMATQLGLAGAQNINAGPLGGEQINQYMSPYMQSVVAGTLAPLRQQQQQEQSALIGDQIRAGAFGGDRGRVAQANLARQQEMATGQTLAGLLQGGYGQALQTAQQQQGLGLSAAQANRAAQQQAASQMAALGQQGYGQQMGLAQQQAALAQQIGALGQQNYAQSMGLSQQLQGLGAQGYQQRMGLSQQLQGLGAQGYQQGMGLGQANAALGQQIYGQRMGAGTQLGQLGSQAQQNELAARQAQMGMGTAEQQTAQAQNQALYNQFLQKQGYDFQTAQFLANIAMGTGALSGQTTTQVSPVSFFGSDRRLKEDIQVVGKTFDGQKIYKFRYKGDPKTQIGLMADDVERHHPESVRHNAIGGKYSAVDYDGATKEAAHKGRFAHGGLAPSSEGGAVSPQHAGLGYEYGGGVYDPSSMAAILQMQKAMFPYAAEGASRTGGGSGPHGMGLMPVNVKPLEAAKIASPPESELHAAANAAKDIEGLVDTGEKAYDKYNEYQSDKAVKGANELGEDAFRRVADWLNTQTQEETYAGGGLVPRHHYAVGGLPYSQAEDEYVPEDETKPKTPESLKAAGQIGDGKNTFGKTLDDVKGIASLAKMFMAHGGLAGRHGYQTDGRVGGLYNPNAVPEADTDEDRANREAELQRELGAEETRNRAFNFALQQEGKGPTPEEGSVYGINPKYHSDVDLNTLTSEGAKDIYRTQYWNAIDGDRLAAIDPGLSHAVFDTAIMAGPGRAKKLLE